MFSETSYDLHVRHIDKQSQEKLAIWRRQDTTDAYVHNKIYDLIIPLTQNAPGSYWLTVGDGRGGTDAHALKLQGVRAHASDLNDVHLRQAVNDGFIDECSSQNAEKLNFGDNTFDFALCKESYHHFPRPMLAFYELLRVSKHAVVIIEPCDSEIFTPDVLTLYSGFYWMWQGMKNSIKRMIGRPIYYEFGFYEEVGNYLYSISRRELIKAAMGIDLPAVAFAGINMIHIPGMEKEIWKPNAPLYKQMLKKLRKLDGRSKMGIRPFNLLCAVVFKSTPKNELITALKASGYDYIALPRNPYNKK